MLPLLILITSWLSPGAELRHRPFLEALATHAPSLNVAVEAIVYAEHESAFGAALGGKRWDARAYGIMQVRDEPWLEHDEPASAVAWLRIRAKAASMCGEANALAALSSGRCDRGTRLAEARASEARWWMLLASLTR
jgi:hypothetical protein